jgi:hypothetical protein
LSAVSLCGFGGIVVIVRVELGLLFGVVVRVRFGTIVWIVFGAVIIRVGVFQSSPEVCCCLGFSLPRWRWVPFRLGLFSNR